MNKQLEPGETLYNQDIMQTLTIKSVEIKTSGLRKEPAVVVTFEEISETVELSEILKYWQVIWR